MTSQLRLESRLNDSECTELIRFIAHSKESLCKHIHFLLVKSDMPGSGTAVTLSCDLSTVSWTNLLLKSDLNLESVQAITALKGKVSPHDVVCHRGEDNSTPILYAALKSSTLSQYYMIEVCEQAMKLKKKGFAEKIIDYSLSTPGKFWLLDIIEKFLSGETKFNVNFTLLVSKMRKQDIHSRGNLNSIIMSSVEGCVQLFIKAIENFEFQVAYNCLEANIEALKANIDLCSLLKINRGNKDSRLQHLQFIERLLKLGFDPNGQTNSTCPLDVVLELSRDYQDEKEMLLLLLLQNGTDIKHCTFPRTKGTTLIHETMQFAIESGKPGAHNLNLRPKTLDFSSSKDRWASKALQHCSASPNHYSHSSITLGVHTLYPLHVNYMYPFLCLI
jgi:hypothetical protein